MDCLGRPKNEVETKSKLKQRKLDGKQLYESPTLRLPSHQSATSETCLWRETRRRR
jgi:hypothetical protein